MTICWNKSFTIDHGIIDEDHKALIASLNRIMVALESRLATAQLIDLIDDLYLLASGHFEREEHLQELLSFPNLHPHRLEHERLLEDLDRIRSQIDVAPPDEAPCNSVEFVDFFQSWIVRHILESDLKMQGCLGETNRPSSELTESPDYLANL